MNLSGDIRLYIRKRFFTQRVVGHWNRLSREVVPAPSLLESKTVGGYSQVHGVTLGVGPVQGQALDSMILVNPFQFSIFCDSGTLWNSK